MAKQVVHLYGASGAGTSTLGRFLCEKTGSFFMDTDDYFWESTDPPFTTKRPGTERIELMRRDISEHERVVISGSLMGWGDVLIPMFSLAIRVETATSVRLERIRRRERQRFGNRIDPGGDMFGTHMEFLKWASAYDEGGLDIRSRRKHDEWETLLQCPVILVDGSLPLEENYEIIMKKCAASDQSYQGERSNQ